MKFKNKKVVILLFGYKPLNNYYKKETYWLQKEKPSFLLLVFLLYKADEKYDKQ